MEFVTGHFNPVSLASVLRFACCDQAAYSIGQSILDLGPSTLGSVNARFFPFANVI